MIVRVKSASDFNNSVIYLSDLFDAQDRLEFLVRIAIQANLTMGENLSKYIASSFSDSADYKKILSLRVENVKNSLKITSDYVKAYKEVLENNPNNSLALTLYAQAMYHQLFSIGLPFKDYAIVEEAISKAIQLDINNSLAYPLMAQIKRNMIGDISIASNCNPENSGTSANNSCLVGVVVLNPLTSILGSVSFGSAIIDCKISSSSIRPFLSVLVL